MSAINEMPDYLRWLAENVPVWASGPNNFIFRDERATSGYYYHSGLFNGPENPHGYTRAQWLTARQQLGLELSDGWSEWRDWSGGDRPVLTGDIVDVEYRDGSRRINVKAGHGGGAEDWSHDGVGRDIIRYRVKLSPKSPAAQDSIMTEEEEREYGPILYDGIARDAFGNEYHDDHADMVNHPKHYQLRPGYEVYDLRQDLARKAAAADVPHSQYSDWDRALEYLLRCWEKNGAEDVKKARWYLDKLIEKLEASA